MEKIRNLISNTMKVDPHTMSQARGRTYGVVYEGIQLAHATDTVVVENIGLTTLVTVDGLNVDHPARIDADNPAKKHGE
ncbi:unnamed protein product [Prunus armeniaca]|uniref:Uncharacterized protein n=1 Tax=Prunus armeniaca TaxID=36596 RepID=A0A6J5Y576_PRUAR|nr:unnamed protein product [Prunus armeniaca]CAB4319547.1 unnamed protein product [Prunus armeniaca]